MATVVYREAGGHHVSQDRLHSLEDFGSLCSVDRGSLAGYPFGASEFRALPEVCTGSPSSTLRKI